MIQISFIRSVDRILSRVCSDTPVSDGWAKLITTEGDSPHCRLPIIGEAQSTAFHPARIYCTGAASDGSAPGVRACQTTSIHPHQGLCPSHLHTLCLWTMAAEGPTCTAERAGRRSTQSHRQPEESVREEDSPPAAQHGEGDR